MLESAYTPEIPVQSTVYAGPILRRAEPRKLCLWLAAKPALAFWLRITDGDRNLLTDRAVAIDEVTAVPVGTYATIWLLEIVLDAPLPEGRFLYYDLGVRTTGAADLPWEFTQQWAPHLCCAGEAAPRFVLHTRINRLLHGSCRRPHHPATDGLCRVDRELTAISNADDYPALLMLSGDQIYADDVAGPILHAIQCIIRTLGLFNEEIKGAEIDRSDQLLNHGKNFYRRDELLPRSHSNEAMLEKVFGGIRKPVFTTASAGNHLITFAEVIALYLLVWSPVPWRWVTDGSPYLEESLQQRYRQEAEHVGHFRDGLESAARALASVPVYMIFDDHDITDDWNLSALWESTAYEHPFSRRIIGNALMAYLVCQGWGNAPKRVEPLIRKLHSVLDVERRGDGVLNRQPQDQLITELLAFNSWHYTLPTSPKVVVLDTRTRRWRSEITRSRPSGLMDWEALTDFQHELLGQHSVIVVSPAPMFGVKLIEVIQKVFTWLGKPLTVDAENWMAHRGAANVLLNIFRHSGTPDNFVILSGDVHYSFAYDIRLRHHPEAPRIWQITSSGIRNEFPDRLLDWLDRLNRWLYAARSPLNWFTKRRRMRIYPRLPSGRSHGERLWNRSGIGEVRLDSEGAPTEIRQLNADTGETRFEAARV